MKLSEFQKQPRGPYAFDVYHHPTLVPSPLGEFTVELQMQVGDSAPPDQAMVDVIQELITQFSKDKGLITELVFEQYMLAADWLEEYETPSGLTSAQLAPYLTGRALTVSRDLDESNEPYYPSSVYMSPKWNVEHGLYFTYDVDGWIRE